MRELDDSHLSDCPDYKPNDEDQEMTNDEERPGSTVGGNRASPADIETGNKDTEHNPGNPVDNQDPILPSISNQRPGLTEPDTGALASAVEICSLTLLALAFTMAQLQEEAATDDDNGNTDKEKA